MRNLETTDAWPEVVQLKDQLSLRELAERFSTTPGAIAGAFERTRTVRNPHGAPERSAELIFDDDLPPEPGEPDRIELTDEVKSAMAKIRPGSKDSMIAKYAVKLGNIPDAEVARLAAVSVRTIASFRARHGIPGYRGPRRSTGARGPRRSRIDPFAHLLGQVPDRVVAEKAGVSLNAVRNYRVKRGIPAAGRETIRRTGISAEAPELPLPLPMPVVGSDGQQAWRVRWRTDTGEVDRIMLADDLVDAATKLRTAGLAGAVTHLSFAGELLG